MIKPLLSPRTITGNATTGLISAARSGLRNIQRSTNLISRAPDVTNEQRFGMNYVEFFGSKKIGKDLKKSMLTIRDSMSSTFGIAKALKDSVTMGAGIFGFVGKLIGGAAMALPIFSLLGIPLLKTALAAIAIGGVGGLFLKYKDEIFDFFENSADKIFNIIKTKSTGFKDFVKDSVKEFFIDVNKTSQFQQTRSESVERLEESLSTSKNLQDIKKAEQAEIKKLQEEKIIYEESNLDKKNTKEYKQQLKAYDDRITEINTGRIPRNKNILQKGLGLIGIKTPSLFESLTTEKGKYPKNYLTLTESEKNTAMLQTLGATSDNLSPTFDDKGNLNENITRLSQTYNKDLERGNLLESQERFAKDVLEYLKEITNSQTVDGGQLSSTDFSKNLTPRIIPKPSENEIKKDQKINRRGSSFNNKGTNVSVLPMGNDSPQPDLARNDTGGLAGGPSMRLYSNVDHDNFVALINKSSLNVV